MRYIFTFLILIPFQEPIAFSSHANNGVFKKPLLLLKLNDDGIHNVTVVNPCISHLEIPVCLLSWAWSVLSFHITDLHVNKFHKKKICVTTKFTIVAIHHCFQALFWTGTFVKSYINYHRDFHNPFVIYGTSKGSSGKYHQTLTVEWVNYSRITLLLCRRSTFCKFLTVYLLRLIWIWFSLGTTVHM